MLKVNQLLQGRYRIVGILGQGGMGAVYKALELELEVECVIKEMFPPMDAAYIASTAAQFKREGRTLAGLRHSNLPRVTQYFEEDGNYYLAMDLITGTSLDKLIPPGGLPEAVVLRYIDQLLGVLEYIHDKGVIHRDIKPANIIIQEDGRAVLVDFGLVKLADGSMVSRSMRGLTPHYAPPEQYTGGTDQRSDLFSLAATMYQALTGSLPVSATDQSSGEALTPVLQLRRDVSQNTARVVMKALTLDRKGRYQTAIEMRAALGGKAAPAAPKVVGVPVQPPVIVAAPATGSERASGTGAPPSQIMPFARGVPIAQSPQRVRPIGLLIGAIGLIMLVLAGIVIVPTLLAPPANVPDGTPSVTPRATAAAASGATARPATRVSASATTASVDRTVTLAAPVAGNILTVTLAPGVIMEFMRVPAGEFVMAAWRRRRRRPPMKNHNIPSNLTSIGLAELK